MCIRDSYYSVPYRLVREQVEVRYTQRTVEVYHRGRRVASHPRSYARGRATTQDDHRPASHRAYLEWTPSRIISWAEETGPATAELVSAIMASKPHPEMGFRSCLGIIRLSARYSPARVEAAAGRARGRDAGEARGCAVRQSLQDGGRSGGSRRRFHASQSEPIAGRRQAEAAGGRMLCSARRAGAPDTPSPGATPRSHARAYSQDRAAFIPYPAAPGL